MEDPIQALIFPFFLQRLHLYGKLWFFLSWVSLDIGLIVIVTPIWVT